MITPFGEIPDRLAVDMSMVEKHEWLTLRFSRRVVLGSMVAGALAVGPAGRALASPTLWKQTPGAAGAVPIAGRHVSFGPRADRNLVVEFASDAPFNRGVVEITSENHGARSEVQVRTVAGSHRYYARADFGDLQPDTEYRYRIVVDGVSAADGACRTGFTEPRPFRFTAFGDQGCGDAQLAVIQRVGALNPTLNLMCGDLCYADQSGQGGINAAFAPENWDLWLDQNDPVTNRIPFLTVPGNHEMEAGYGPLGYVGFLTRVNLGGESPPEVPTATSLRLGNVLFVGLDTNDVSYEIPANRGWSRGAQTEWLRRVLSDARRPGSGIDFVVAFMHAAPYSTHSSHACEGGIVEAWAPLFDEFTVDLVISGHNHCFERTQPIRAGRAVTHHGDVFASELGTTYVTAGGGGETPDPKFILYAGKTRVATESGLQPVTQDWSTVARYGAPSVLSVDVVPATRSRAGYLEVRALRPDGSELDRIVLTRGEPTGFGDVLTGVGVSTGMIGVGAAAVHFARKNSKSEDVAFDAPSEDVDMSGAVTFTD